MNHDRAFFRTDDTDLVEDGLIAHPVLTGTIEDPWLLHKLPWISSNCKVTCESSGAGQETCLQASDQHLLFASRDGRI